MLLTHLPAGVKAQVICWCWETSSSLTLLFIQVNRNEPVSGWVTLGSDSIRRRLLCCLRHLTVFCFFSCTTSLDWWSRGQLCPGNEWPVQPVPGGSWLWGGHVLELLLLHGEILQGLQGWWSAQKNRWGYLQEIQLHAYNNCSPRYMYVWKKNCNGKITSKKRILKNVSHLHAVLEFYIPTHLNQIRKGFMNVFIFAIMSLVVSHTFRPKS